MFDCDKTRDRISFYIDKTLSSTEEKEFEAHLNVCSECKKELDAEIFLLEICSEIPDEELPKNFKNQLHKRLCTESNKENKGVMIRLKPYITVFSSVAAVILIIFLVKGITWNNYRTSGNTSMVQSQNRNLISPNQTSTPPNGAQNGFAIKEKNNVLTTPDSQNTDKLQQNKKVDQKDLEKRVVNQNDSGSNSSNTDSSHAQDNQTSGQVTFTATLKAPSSTNNDIRNINITLSTENPDKDISEIINQLAAYNALVVEVSSTQAALSDNSEKIFSSYEVKNEQVLNYKIPNTSYNAFIKFLKEKYPGQEIELGIMNVKDLSGEIDEYKKKLDELIKDNKTEEIKKTQNELDKLISDTGFTLVTIIIKY